jgi:hypothetical protein
MPYHIRRILICDDVHRHLLLGFQKSFENLVELVVGYKQGIKIQAYVYLFQ